MNDTNTAPKTEVISEKRAKYLEKRKKLIALSESVREYVDEGAFETVNEAIKATYQNEGHEVLNTYHQWRESGYQVVKGSEALLVWGRPRQSQQGDDDEEKQYKFWPLCYLFSNLQVEVKQ